MGTNAAVISRKVIENTYEVMGIEWMGLLQAVDYLGIETQLAPITQRVYNDLRKIVPKFVEDSVKYPAVQAMKDYLWETQIEL